MSIKSPFFTFFINNTCVQAPLVDEQGRPTGELNDAVLGVTVDKEQFLTPTLEITDIPHDECPASLIVGEVVSPGMPGHRGSKGLEIVSTTYRIHPLIDITHPGMVMVGDVVMAPDTDEPGVMHCYMPIDKGIVLNFAMMKACVERERFRHFAIGFERPGHKPWFMSIHEQEKTGDVIDIMPRLRLATDPNT